MTDYPDWHAEPRDIPAELDEWWAWHLESERDPAELDDEEFARMVRIVTIDPSPYL